MHVAEPAAGLDRIRTSPAAYARLLLDDAASILNGRVALLAFMTGITWLALIGAAVGVSILTSQTASVSGHGVAAPTYRLYEIGWAVPTDFGSLTVDSAGLNGIGVRQSPINPVDPDEPIDNPDKVQLQLTLTFNNQLDQRVAAPRAQDFRVVTTWGSEADRVPALSSAPEFVGAHSAEQAQLTYMAPEDGSVLWLEYRDGQRQRPVRVQLGWANDIPQYATEPIPVATLSKP